MSVCLRAIAADAARPPNGFSVAVATARLLGDDGCRISIFMLPKSMPAPESPPPPLKIAHAATSSPPQWRRHPRGTTRTGHPHGALGAAACIGVRQASLPAAGCCEDALRWRQL